MICIGYENIVIVVCGSLLYGVGHSLWKKPKKTCLEMHTFSEGYRISASVILTIENGLNSAIDWSKCRCLIRVHTYTTYITITCLKKKCNITLRGSDSLWKSVVSFDTCVFLWPASSNPNNQWRFKMNFAVKKIWCPDLVSIGVWTQMISPHSYVCNWIFFFLI